MYVLKRYLFSCELFERMPFVCIAFWAVRMLG